MPATDNTTTTENPGYSSALIHAFGSASAAIAILSGVYHLSAVFLHPLPGELHPNMHLFLAFWIILLSWFFCHPDSYDVSRLDFSILVMSIAPAVFVFYFSGEAMGKIPESYFSWLYVLPFVVLGILLVRDRAWFCLGLSMVSLLPTVLLFLNWGSLGPDAQQSSNWWLLVSASVPTGWIVFTIFYRPRQGIQRALPYILMGLILAVIGVQMLIHGIGGAVTAFSAS